MTFQRGGRVAFPCGVMARFGQGRFGFRARRMDISMNHRSSFRTARPVWVALSLVASLQVHAQDHPGRATWSTDPVSRCEFVVPLSMGSGPAYWTGECTAKKASGFGMLRRRDGERVGPAFFGQMRAGLPVVGVIDDEGYRVGKFKDGDIGNDAELEPQLRIDAFRAAAKAAREVGARFAKQGNSASARHYQSVAQQLERQIE